MAYIGKGVPGKLDHILVAGKGQYTADVSLPGMGFMTILRSPFAHAKITSIDVDAARRLPGVRLVPAEEFFVGYLTTALNADEIVTEVRVPVLPVRTGSAYVKHRRIEGGFAIVGSAAIVELDNNICQRISVAVSGGGAIPFCIPDVEGRCHGKRMDESLITEIAEAAYNAAEDPTNELHANAEYKREMVRVFTKRAVRVAVERVGG